MDSTVWWILLLVVGLIVGPFAALRAVSALRARRGSTSSVPQPAASRDEELDEDGKPKSGGFW